MLIHKKRIINTNSYLYHLPPGSSFIVGIANPNRFSHILRRIGFKEPYEIGQQVLPARIGPISNYNSEGKSLIHNGEPMETAYRQSIWHWTEWHGPYRVEQSKIVDIPYKRYRRSFIAPPAVELTHVIAPDDRRLLVAPILKNAKSNEDEIKHTINLFLEIFGECEIFTGSLESIIKTQIKRLNWIILPQGQMPWEQVKKNYDPIVKSAPEGKQSILYYRLETVNNLNPDFRAIGRGGFHGYIVHGFTAKNLYVLESMRYGNATYIFDETWEELSKKTKAEILNENLQMRRVIHRGGWKRKIEEVVNKKG